MLIDTHCHLNMMVKKNFDTLLTDNEIKNVAPILQQAKQQRVETIITVGTSIIETKNCIEIAKNYSNVFATAGIHPTDCSINWHTHITKIKHLLKDKKNYKIVAIGECGLDFYWPGYNIQLQKDLFKAQIELALEHNLALTIHTRNASEETIRVLEEFRGQIKGVLHCFSESIDYGNDIINIGLMLGIGGIITYPKNENLRTAIKALPLEKIVLETDAPWLSPQKVRGKQNHPKYINEIAHYIAELKQKSFEEVARQTTENAQLLFGLN